MLENVLFFINIPKIAVSSRRFVILLQRLLNYCAEILLYYSEILLFCWWGCKVWFCSPAQGTLAPLLILTEQNNLFTSTQTIPK